MVGLQTVRFVGQKVGRKSSVNPGLAWSGFEEPGPDVSESYDKNLVIFLQTEQR